MMIKAFLLGYNVVGLFLAAWWIRDLIQHGLGHTREAKLTLLAIIFHIYILRWLTGAFTLSSDSLLSVKIFLNFYLVGYWLHVPGYHLRRYLTRCYRKAKITQLTGRTSSR